VKTNGFVVVSLLSSVIAGCVSNTLQVRSTPDGADVTLVAPDGSVSKPGKTPLTLDSRANPAVLSSVTQVRVSKDGFLTQSAVVPSLGTFGGNGTLQFNLSETELPKICSAQDADLNELARSIAEGTALIQKRRLGDASQLFQSLTIKFPSVAAVYDLLGNTYYLQKDFAKALAAYRRSHAISPNNSSAAKMIAKLEMLQGSGGGQ
jgi:TolA-binding protein